ncbi:hypothetical protein EON81_23455 [bacterium]|nr:MAG: hypothetical protein EON81_23455 [bacterium]
MGVVTSGRYVVLRHGEYVTSFDTLKELVDARLDLTIFKGYTVVDDLDPANAPEKPRASFTYRVYASAGQGNSVVEDLEADDIDLETLTIEAREFAIESTGFDFSVFVIDESGAEVPAEDYFEQLGKGEKP